MENITDRIKREVLSWSGVTCGPHRFGGLEFRIDNSEIGHLHGRYQADIPFSARLRKELVAMGLASPHHIYPNSGWVSFYIQGVEDVPNLIKLLRLNYDRLTTKRRSNSSKESAEVGANTALASAPSGQQ